eukprot:CAMPEP_0175857862 /NCGR_PEP_ID=MMETSP0107_2-20121207/29329_1 /TAXON_ID=195067 ORGANISM="Goniomonas pacifica, Strain CCMP1869" /NCGR_SAMPLE_ID=MMETSP0107_2 /ASSEMBLY_ACC=CAM_ASM_000203 /LENGTH=71 /DNA_ID=CAMNT_0017174205 /DNA_START=800 /DNA_END=1015 /DNA_ORIENTATION=-
MTAPIRNSLQMHQGRSLVDSGSARFVVHGESIDGEWSGEDDVDDGNVRVIKGASGLTCLRHWSTEVEVTLE